jgi:hypothetical protein
VLAYALRPSQENSRLIGREIRLGGPSPLPCSSLREPEMVLRYALRHCVTQIFSAKGDGRPARQAVRSQARGAYWIVSNGQSRSSHARTAW